MSTLARSARACSANGERACDRGVDRDGEREEARRRLNRRPLDAQRHRTAERVEDGLRRRVGVEAADRRRPPSVTPAGTTVGVVVRRRRSPRRGRGRRVVCEHRRGERPGGEQHDEKGEKALHARRYTRRQDPWIVRDDTVDTCFDEGCCERRLVDGPDVDRDPEPVAHLDRARRDDGRIERHGAGSGLCEPAWKPRRHERAQDGERRAHARARAAGARRPVPVLRIRERARERPARAPRTGAGSRARTSSRSSGRAARVRGAPSRRPCSRPRTFTSTSTATPRLAASERPSSSAARSTGASGPCASTRPRRPLRRATSSSTTSTPCATAASIASRLFSGASAAAPR